MTAFHVLIAVFGFAAAAIVAVTSWQERLRRRPSQPTREQADWELHVAEAIRIARGDLDTRTKHEREIERFRTELNEWGKRA